jgi:hypothetical protein
LGKMVSLLANGLHAAIHELFAAPEVDDVQG